MEEGGGGGGGPPPPLWPPSLHGRWPRGHTRRCTPPRTTERSNGRSAAGAETRGDSGELRAPSAPSLPCLLAAKGGGHRGGGGGGGGIHGAPRTFSETIRCSWTLRRLHDGPLASPLLSSSYSPFVSLSRRLSAFSPLIFVLGFSTRVLVSQFLNKKTICDVYSTSFLQSRAKSIVPLSLYRGLSFVSISNLLKMIICLNNSSCQFNIIFFLLFLPN